MRRLRQLLGRGAVLVLHDIPRDFIFPIVFVLAVLTVVAAGSLGLLVRTSKICTEKMAAAFTSFPVSLVGAVLRRSSSMLAIPFKRAF